MSFNFFKNKSACLRKEHIESLTLFVPPPLGPSRPPFDLKKKCERAKSQVQNTLPLFNALNLFHIKIFLTWEKYSWQKNVRSGYLFLVLEKYENTNNASIIQFLMLRCMIWSLDQGCIKFLIPPGRSFQVAWKEYQDAKKGKEYQGYGEKNNVKKGKESNILFPMMIRLLRRISSGEGGLNIWGRKSIS